MIKAEHLSDRKGAGRFGTCAGCCKPSEKDEKMVRVSFGPEDAGRISVCLCDECRKELKTRMG